MFSAPSTPHPAPMPASVGGNTFSSAAFTGPSTRCPPPGSFSFPGSVTSMFFRLLVDCWLMTMEPSKARCGNLRWRPERGRESPQCFPDHNSAHSHLPLAAHIPCAPHLAAEVQAPPPLMMDCDALSWRPLSNGRIAPDSPLLLISFCAPRLRLFSNGRAPFLLPPPLPPTLPLPAADSNLSLFSSLFPPLSLRAGSNASGETASPVPTPVGSEGSEAMSRRPSTNGRPPLSSDLPPSKAPGKTRLPPPDCDRRDTGTATATASTATAITRRVRRHLRAGAVVEPAPSPRIPHGTTRQISRPREAVFHDESATRGE
mmetsp:Transcript_17449/g.43214  ORF Transcript_17449/g.43214 Transcript_17449/m.43214 type:complete len:316 (+) Transcript_17449:1115-2062(+)